MDRKKKVGLSALILGVGVGVALQFRKIESTVAPAESLVPRPPAATDRQTGAAVSSNGSAARPATAFDGRIESAPNDAIRSGAARSVNTFHATPLAPGENNAEGNLPLANLNEPDKIHKIVDGDTLPKLAQRYWGRADRYADLYAYNRDVLSDPDVLPIGAELRIPVHLVVATNTNQAATAPPLPLAPLPQIKTPGAPALPAAAQPPSQRTYKVEAGDNLVDIARKLYGDGRKHTALFEANRRVMRSPTDLKPGTLLVVP